MFWRILKKDLTRKKTMNVILLLFVIICAMFTAPAVNNIFAVTNGLDGYFEKAGMADYYVISRSKSGENKAAQALEQSQYVSGFRAEQTIYAAAENMQTDSGKLMDYSNVVLLCDISDAKLNFFDPDDRIVKEVDAGKVYLSRGIADRKGVRKGDRFTVCLGDTELPLEVAGFVKDALFGSEMMGNPRFLLNSRDFQTLCADETVHSYSMGQIFYIDTADANALESELTGFSGILFSGTNKMIQTTYFMYMLVAVLILLISIGLLTVAIVVLRFTIGFTVSEEFREIGVMKAIGLRNGQIRALYLVKYLGIALIGAVIGYFAGIPFNRMLLRSVSENIVLGSSHSTLIRILCCAAVVLMILLFSWGSTRKVSRLSPIDAVRSGQTGERFRKRSLLHLGRSRLGSTGFLAANDVLSESRQYGILTVIFTICASLVMMLAVTADTLGSEGLLYLLSVAKSDAYLSDPGRAMEVMAGQKTIRQTEEEIEAVLAEHGMPGSVILEAWYKLPVSANGRQFQINLLQCTDTETTDYEYTDGTPPLSADEAAVTKQIADKLGVGIGDHIRIRVEDTEQEVLITALFQCFNNLGECIRIHQDLRIPDELMSAAFSYQIRFDDHPDTAELNTRIAALREIFDTKNVFDTKGFVADCTGVGGTLQSVKNLVLLLSMIIIVLMVVLMERSFIAKEKAEIALMKAVGFDSGSVILHHTLRFGITILAALVISAALFRPLNRLLINPLFGIMGANGRIAYQVNAAEIYGCYPLLILGVTVLSAALTALYTKTIRPSDTASIE